MYKKKKKFDCPLFFWYKKRVEEKKNRILKIKRTF